MRKTRYILLIIGFVILLISFLVISSKSLERPGGFIRNVRQDLLSVKYLYTQGEHLSNWAGMESNRIYLATYDPSILNAFDLNSGEKWAIKLNFKYSHIVKSLFWVFVDSSRVKIFAGNARCFYSGSLNGKEFKRDSVYDYNFSQVFPISNESYILRGPDKNYKDQFLRKYNAITQKSYVENGLIDHLADGGIATDGTLVHDDRTGWFIYSHFYKNEFVCFDSNLNLTGRFSSIDTCKNYQTIAFSQSQHSDSVNFTIKSIPKFVHQACDAKDGRLYVHSRQWAENETRSEFINNSVIDVYDLLRMKYLYSFYIPNRNDKHLMRFKVLKQAVFATYDRTATLFSMRDSFRFYR